MGGVPASNALNKKDNDKFILLNNNKPTYSSKLEASKELKMSAKTISKYLGGCALRPLKKKY